jgi:hypothetical protein
VVSLPCTIVAAAHCLCQFSLPFAAVAAFHYYHTHSPALLPLLVFVTLSVFPAMAPIAFVAAVQSHGSGCYSCDCNSGHGQCGHCICSCRLTPSLLFIAVVAACYPCLGCHLLTLSQLALLLCIFAVVFFCFVVYCCCYRYHHFCCCCPPFG